jgi:hypothetical protein
MSDDDLKKRLADQEAFKYQIVADQARISTKVDLLYDMVKAELNALKTRVDKIEDKHDTLKEAIAGGLAKPGILEQNRNFGKDLAKLFGVISVSGLVLWKIISPIYDAWVNRWIPQRIATAAQPQTEVKSSKIIRKSLPSKPVDSEIKKQ